MSKRVNEQVAKPEQASPPHDEPKDRFVEAVNQGLADVAAGRVHSDAEVAKRMAARFR